MNQKDFSTYIVACFIKKFPQMKSYELDTHKDVNYLELESGQKLLNILVSTRDNMLTVGFEAGKGLFYWHKHLLGEDSLDEKIELAFDWIDDITLDKTGIIYSSVLGYLPGTKEDLEETKKYQERDEVVEFRYWSEF